MPRKFVGCGKVPNDPRKQMAKSIYSLLLSDDAVRAIDRIASKRNMSRSAVIDEILSEHTGTANANNDFRKIWTEVEGLFARAETMHFVNNAQVNLAQVITSLPYKYNPKVRYMLELSDKPHTLCTITLNTRTQNPFLSAVFGTFYARLAQLEDRYLSNVSASVNGGKYVSVLYGEESDTADVSRQIVEYILTLDGMLRAFVCGDDDTTERLFVTYAMRHNAHSAPKSLPSSDGE